VSNKPPRPPIPPRHEKDISDVSSTFLNKLGAAERASIELKNANAALAKKEAELSSLKEQINRRVGPSSPQEMKAVEQAGFDIDAARRRVESVRESVKLKTAERTASTIMDRRVHENQFSTLTKAISSDPNLISQEYQRLIGDRQVTPQLLHELSSKNSAILSHLKPTVRTNIATGLYGSKSRDDVASTVMTSRLGDYSQALKDKAGLAVISSDYDRKQKEAEKAQRDAQKAEEKKALDAQKMANKAKEEEDKKLKFEEVQGKKREREESDKRELVRKANSRAQKDLFKQEIADELIVEKEADQTKRRKQIEEGRQKKASDEARDRLARTLGKDESRAQSFFISEASKGGLQGLAKAFGSNDPISFADTQRSALADLKTKLQELGEVFANTSTLTKEQIKSHENLNKSYEKQQKIVDAIDRVSGGGGTGSGGGGGSTPEKIANNLLIASAAIGGVKQLGGAIDYAVAGSQYQELSVQKRIAEENNRYFFRKRDAERGDAGARMLLDMGVEDLAATKGNAMQDHYLKYGGVNAFLNMAGGVTSGMASFAGGNIAGAIGSGAGALSGAITDSTNLGLNLTQVVKNLEMRGLQREKIEEIMRPATEAANKAYSFNQGRLEAVSGAGGMAAEVFGAISPSELLNTIGGSPEEARQIVSMGVRGVGQQFMRDPKNILKRAGAADRAHVMDRSDYLSSLAQVVNAGGGQNVLEGIINASSAYGMGGSKSINSMAGAVSSMSAPLMASGIEGGIGMTALLSGALSSTSGSSYSQETRMAMAQSGLSAFNNASSTKVDLAGIIAANRTMADFSGKDGSALMAIQGTNIEELMAVRDMPKGEERTLAMKGMGLESDQELNKAIKNKIEETGDRIVIGIGNEKVSNEVKELIAGKRTPKALSVAAASTLRVAGQSPTALYRYGQTKANTKSDDFLKITQKNALNPAGKELSAASMEKTATNISKNNELREGDVLQGGGEKRMMDALTSSNYNTQSINQISDQIKGQNESVSKNQMMKKEADASPGIVSSLEDALKRGGDLFGGSMNNAFLQGATTAATGVENGFKNGVSLFKEAIKDAIKEVKASTSSTWNFDPSKQKETRSVDPAKKDPWSN
jgi:hypothetical protein